jgi:hypothetical protein
LIFKTRFEEIRTKPDLENKINSNIDHRQSTVFLFNFKVPPRDLIWNDLFAVLKSNLINRLFLSHFNYENGKVKITLKNTKIVPHHPQKRPKNWGLFRNIWGNLCINLRGYGDGFVFLEGFFLDDFNMIHLLTMCVTYSMWFSFLGLYDTKLGFKMIWDKRERQL